MNDMNSAVGGVLAAIVGLLGIVAILVAMSFDIECGDILPGHYACLILQK